MKNAPIAECRHSERQQPLLDSAFVERAAQQSPRFGEERRSAAGLKPLDVLGALLVITIPRFVPLLLQLGQSLLLCCVELRLLLQEVLGCTALLRKLLLQLTADAAYFGKLAAELFQLLPGLPILLSFLSQRFLTLAAFVKLLL